MSENTTNILNVVSIRRAIKLPAVAQIGKKSSCQDTFIQFFETVFITEIQKLNEIIIEWLSKAITVSFKSNTAVVVVIHKQNISTKITVRCWPWLYKEKKNCISFEV